MVAISDKFGKSSADNHYGVATSVSGARSAGETVLPCYDLSTYSTTAPVFFLTYKKTVDPDTGKSIVINQTGWKGIVNTDNNTITNLVLAPGYTDTGNALGDFVEPVPTSFWENSLIDGLLVSLDQNGKVRPTALDDNETIRLRQAEQGGDFVVNGTGVIAQQTLLTGSFSDITYYIGGNRFQKTAIANKSYSTAKDTYVFINKTGAVTYTEVANNAAAPSTPVDNVAVAKVVTDGTTITSVRLLSRGAIKSSNIDYSSPQSTGDISLYASREDAGQVISPSVDVELQLNTVTANGISKTGNKYILPVDGWYMIRYSIVCVDISTNYGVQLRVVPPSSTYQIIDKQVLGLDNAAGGATRQTINGATIVFLTANTSVYVNLVVAAQTRVGSNLNGKTSLTIKKIL